MENFLTFSRFALTKLLSLLVLGVSGSPISATASSSHDDRCWHDDYLVGKSDMDAAWYYERRRWQ